jgi:hypothetical protein
MQEPIVELVQTPNTPEINVNLDEKEIKDPSLTKLKELEDNLLEAIDDIADDDLKEALREQATSETTTVKAAGIDELDSNVGSVKMQDKDRSPNLTAYQKHSKKFFDDKLKAAQEEEDVKKNIIAKLTAVHKMREALLKKALEEEDKKRMKKASNDLFDKLGDYYTKNANGEEEIEARGSGGVTPARDFMEELNKAGGHLRSSAQGSIYVRKSTSDNTLSSNDPEALGLAIVAAGHATCEFKGAPMKAIAAAEAALKAGLKEASFDSTTLQKIRSRSSYRNEKEYQNAIERLDGIKNWSDTNKGTRADNQNGVFNEKQAVSDNAHKFARFAPELPGHVDMFKSLTLDERVELAQEIGNKTFKVMKDGTKTLKNMDGYEYIKFLIKKTAGAGAPIQRDSFEKSYGVKVSEKIINDLKGEQDPKEVARKIAEQKNNTVKKFCYQKIDTLSPHQSATLNQDFRNKVRAALMGNEIDRHLAEYNPDPTGKGNSFFNSAKKNSKNSSLKGIFIETTSLLNGVPPEDRAKIVEECKTNYKRDDKKIHNYTTTHPEFVGLSDEMVREAARKDFNQFPAPKEFQQALELDDSDELHLTTPEKFKHYERLWKRAQEAAIGNGNKPNLMKRNNNDDDDMTISNEEPDPHRRPGI